MKLFFTALLIMLDLAATVYDVEMTEKGIKKGVGVEGNEFVDAIDRTNKPGTAFLMFWNMGFIGLVAGALAFSDNPAVLGFGFVMLAVDAIKHVIGGRMWSKLLSGGTIKQDHTIWQKFLGLGQS